MKETYYIFTIAVLMHTQLSLITKCIFHFLHVVFIAPVNDKYISSNPNSDSTCAVGTYVVIITWLLSYLYLL